MRSVPPNSPQELFVYRDRVLEAITAINDCMPTESGVQAISSGLVNSCTSFDGAESVLALQLKEAICYLQTQTGSSSLVGLDALLRTAITALAVCFSDVTAVTDIAAEVTVNSTLVELIDIYNRMVEESLCYLKDLYCTRPWGCDTLTVNTVASFPSDLFVYDSFAPGFLFPTLAHVSGNFYFSPRANNDAYPMVFMKSVSLPALLTVTGSLVCVFQQGLLSFSAPLLTSVSGNLTVGSNAVLNSIDLSSLVSVTGTAELGGNLNTSMLLPSLTTVGGDLKVGGNQVATVDISALSSLGGGFNAQNSNLNAAQINAILIKLDSLGLTGRLISLDVGLNAAPTGAGLAAKASLILAGNTVNTN